MNSLDREVTKVGIVGCGNIFENYAENISRYNFLEIHRLADIDVNKARHCAKKTGVQHAGSLEEMLHDPEVEILVNLTIPNVHAEVSLRGLEAGKHVYSEKPLATNLDDARILIEKAEEKKRRLGCAPDTVLGGGIQTSINLIREGAIGKPVAATAFFMSHGMESWHPNPDFFYKKGGGPILDIGPYYLTTLIHLIGPVAEVSGMAMKSFKQRKITSLERQGELIDVEIPTHVSGSLHFKNGGIGTLLTTWDVWAHHLPVLEIHGTEGSLSVPDPNCFDGEVKLFTPKISEWKNIPLTHCSEMGRGAGVADMARAIKTGRPHRASGEMAYHVLEVMLALATSSQTKKHIPIQSSCLIPEMLSIGLPPNQMD